MRLPVEPERLRERFPSLTDDDLAAYAEVTRRLLADPARRGGRLADVLSAAQRGREKEAAAAPLEDEERLALAYVRALEKMQGR
ncbi:MAG TPA: hypothetical protein VLF95_13850 [Vicinamibacteria bacterium]|nr:hypothetical protein [Vicinamibacteria bacterium]